MTMCVRRFLFESYPTFDVSLGKIPVFNYQFSSSKSKVTTIYAIRAINEMSGKLPNCAPPSESLAHISGERGVSTFIFFTAVLLSNLLHSPQLASILAFRLT